MTSMDEVVEISYNGNQLLDNNGNQLLNENQSSDKNINIPVCHIFAIKSINDNNDELTLITTIMQQCIIPAKYQSELVDESPLQFNYRFNNESASEESITKRKLKIIDVIDNKNEYFKAVSRTYSMKIPLHTKIGRAHV